MSGGRKKVWIGSAFVVVTIAIIVLIVFLWRKPTKNTDESSRILQSYEEQIQFAKDHSDEILEVSDVLLNHKEFIKENEDYDLEKLKATLNEEQKSSVDFIAAAMSYQWNLLLSDDEAYSQCIHYRCDSIKHENNMEEEVVIVYTKDPKFTTGGYDHEDKITKINDNLYVLLVRYYYV